MNATNFTAYQQLEQPSWFPHTHKGLQKVGITIGTNYNKFISLFYALLIFTKVDAFYRIHSHSKRFYIV